MSRLLFLFAIFIISCRSENSVSINTPQLPQSGSTSTSTCENTEGSVLDVSQSFTQGNYSSLLNRPDASSICIGTTLFGVAGTANCIAPGEVPTTVNGLTMWFRAGDKTYSDNNLTEVINADAIESWVDNNAATYSLSQSSALNQPSFIASDANFNNQSVVSFDGNDKMMFNSGIFNTNFIVGTYTMFLVFSSADSNAHIVGTASSQNGYLESWGAGFYLGANGEIKYKAIDNSSGLKVSSTTTDFTSPVIVTLSTDCSSTTLYVNGSSEATSNTACQQTVYTHSSFGASDGYSNGTIIDPFTGKVAEYIVYNSLISNANREAIQCYLASRYGITVGHSCN